MDSKEALDKIKETEQKAQGIIEQVRIEAAHILDQAKEEKERINAQKQARK